MVIVADSAGRIWMFVVVVVRSHVALASVQVLAAVEASVLAAQVLLVLGIAVARILSAPSAVSGVVHARTKAVLDAEVACGADADAVGR